MLLFSPPNLERALRHVTLNFFFILIQRRVNLLLDREKQIDFRQHFLQPTSTCKLLLL